MPANDADRQVALAIMQAFIDDDRAKAEALAAAHREAAVQRERAAVVAWLRTDFYDKHALMLADGIEAGYHSGGE